jgi:hypothetical protein
MKSLLFAMLVVVTLFVAPTLTFGQVPLTSPLSASPMGATSLCAPLDPDWANATTLYAAHFTVGGGISRNGVLIVDGYETALSISNTSSNTEMQISALLRGADGHGMSAQLNDAYSNELKSFSGVSIPQACNSSRELIISDAVPDIKTGWIRVKVPPAPQGQPPISVGLIFRYKVGGVTKGQANVDLMEPKKDLAFFAKVYQDPRQDQVNTGMALANPFTNAAACVVTRTDVVGGLVDFFNITIPPMGQVVGFLNQMKELPTLTYQGQVQVRCQSPIVGMALQTSGSGETFTFSTIKVIY